MEKVLLALDCSLRWTNVAVCLNGDILVSERLDLGRNQAAELPLVVKKALSDAGYSFAQVGRLAVTNGPGYFTGIRVGAAYAAALAYGLGIKITPVSTLHMLASLAKEQAPQKSKLLVAVYAGRERVYAASFGCGNELPSGEYGKDDIEGWLLGNTDVKVASDNPEKTFLPSLSTLPGLGEILTTRPDASEVARIAWQCPDAAVSPMDFRAIYHRSPL